MAKRKSHPERCEDLKRWLLDHNGVLPRRRSNDTAEASLAKWLSMAQPRCHRAFGSHPSQRQLDAEERSQLTDALKVFENDLAAQAREGLKTAREELAAKDEGHKELKRKITELQCAAEEPGADDIKVRRMIAELQCAAEEWGVADRDSVIKEQRQMIAAGAVSEAATAASDALDIESSTAASAVEADSPPAVAPSCSRGCKHSGQELPLSSTNNNNNSGLLERYSRAAPTARRKKAPKREEFHAGVQPYQSPMRSPPPVPRAREIVML